MLPVLVSAEAGAGCHRCLTDSSAPQLSSPLPAEHMEPDTLLSEYEHYNQILEAMTDDCDEDLCAPPVFDLPPPPPPPWLDMPPLCDNCDSVPGVTRTNNVQDIFKNIVIIIVMSISIIITLITLTVIIRRKYLSKNSSSAENLTSGVTPEKQLAHPGPVSPGNYYSRDHHILVDTRGRSILIPSQTLHTPIVSPHHRTLQLDTSDAGHHIYESIDSSVYSGYPQYHVINSGASSSVYENPDSSVYNTTITTDSSQYQEVGPVKTLQSFSTPGLVIKDSFLSSTTPAGGAILTEVRLHSYKPRQHHHISPL